jgi:sialidase-1
MSAWRALLTIACSLFVCQLAQGQPPAGPLDLGSNHRDRCLTILRTGLQSEEFWPAMHAAEALSLAGFGGEVRQAIAHRLPVETDDQRRCGLARELVRAGDLAHVQLLLDILSSENPHGHIHAAESLFKIWQIGDGRKLRETIRQTESPKKVLMSAAALSRFGSPAALQLLRNSVQDQDGEIARIAAWILARTGDETDVIELRAGAKRFEEPLTKAYFQHALAALGDPAGLAALIQNLRSTDPSVRVYACEFAPDARALGAKQALIELLDDQVLDVRIRAAQALLMLAQPAPLGRNEQVVRDVFLATAENPRYSEGSVAVLRDGRLLYATTEFIGSESDFASARIVGVESTDEGQTWGPVRVIQENVGKKNVMSVSLRRLTPGVRFDAPLGCFYLVKNSFTDLQVFLRTSSDEGHTFGKPVPVTNAAGYHVLNNDRVTILSTGRMIVPVSSTEDVGKVNHFVCSCFFSDDNGATWARSRNTVDYDKRGAMEPEVLELNDGRLLMHFRTQLGHIAVSESKDQGLTWSTARSWYVRAPEAPATLRRIPSTGDLLLVWNDTFTEGAGHGGKRTPLTAAISTDEGRTWTKGRNIETDADHTYAYTSIVFHRGRALLTYYVSDEKTGRISSRFRSIPIESLYQSPTSP